ncbi:DUF401 family protein [Fibrobacterota bacterium]
METFTTTPYVIRVLVSLLIILAVHKLCKYLSLSVLAGLLVLVVWTGQPVQTVLSISWMKLSSGNTLFLLITILQVIWLSTQMAETGIMKDLTHAVINRTSQRVSMALLPAVIGLLPMPGGALFSAPLVDDCDVEKKLEPILKARINYWFRHIWEYWWPLYPGVLLAVEISGLSILQFMLLQFSLCLLSICAGYLFLLRKVTPQVTGAGSDDSSSLGAVFKPLLPIILVLAIYTAIKVLLPQIADFNKYLPMMAGILVAQIVLQVQRPLIPVSWRRIILSKTALNMVFLISLVLIYGAFVDSRLPDGTPLMSHMRSELSSWGVPLFFIIMLIPFICGLTTGVAVGMVGASFPIVMSLISPDPGFRELASTVLLAYGSGYIGMILSPVHICLIVTNQHFKTGMPESILKLIKPSLFVLTGAVVLHILIR